MAHFQRLVLNGPAIAVIRGCIWGLLSVAACNVSSARPLTTGQVRDVVTGHGIPGVSVTAVTSKERTTTDSNGNFEFKDWQTSFSYERTGYRNMSPYELIPGELRKGYDANGTRYWTPVVHLMMPVGVLSGVVVDEKQRPIPDVQITLIAPRPIVLELANRGKTDSSGRFRLALDGIETELMFADPRCSPNAALLPGNPPLRRVFLRRSFQLTSGENREVQINLPATSVYSVMGEVRNHVQPFSGGIVSITLEPSLSVSDMRTCLSSYSTLDQSGGTFSIKAVPPGQYRLTVRLHRQLTCDTCSEEPVYRVSRDVRVDNSELKNLLFDFYPGLEIAGAIHRDGIPPAQRSEPSVYISDGARNGYGDENREKKPNIFHFSRVQPGTYQVHVSNGTLREVRLDGQILEANTITVKPGIGHAQLDVFLLPELPASKTARCNVEVVDREGHPLTSYTMRLMQRQGSRFVFVPFAGIAPGEYFVVAVTPALPSVAISPENFVSYADRATRVVLSAGQTLDMKVVAIERVGLSR